MTGMIELTDEERSYVAQRAAAKAGFLSMLAVWLPISGRSSCSAPMASPSRI